MLKTSSITEQAASYLRDGLKKGRWTGLMPGRGKLTAELGVNPGTVERALVQLEKEGLLKSQGVGRRRKIVTGKGKARSAMQVKLILYERDDTWNNYILQLRRHLLSSGHQLEFAPKTLQELKQDPKRVAKMVKAYPDSAWIAAGASRPVLEWLAKSRLPAFALFGRMGDLPIAGTGPDKRPALQDALHQLTDAGHTRIVMLTRAERRTSGYGLYEQKFLDELNARGISTGSYNIPDWEETPEGLNQCLNELFAVTPPTAILVSDTTLCLPIKNYLASNRGPDLRKVALICTDYHLSFDWCVPPIPHFRWDEHPIVRRVVRWVNNVARGKDDRRQNLIPSKFVGGETIGPPSG